MRELERANDISLNFVNFPLGFLQYRYKVECEHEQSSSITKSLLPGICKRLNSLHNRFCYRFTFAVIFISVITIGLVLSFRCLL